MKKKVRKKQKELNDLRKKWLTESKPQKNLATHRTQSEASRQRSSLLGRVQTGEDLESAAGQRHTIATAGLGAKLFQAAREAKAAQQTPYALFKTVKEAIDPEEKESGSEKTFGGAVFGAFGNSAANKLRRAVGSIKGPGGVLAQTAAKAKAAAEALAKNQADQGGPIGAIQNSAGGLSGTGLGAQPGAFSPQARALSPAGRAQSPTLGRPRAGAESPRPGNTSPRAVSPTASGRESGVNFEAHGVSPTPSDAAAARGTRGEEKTRDPLRGIEHQRQSMAWAAAALGAGQARQGQASRRSIFTELPPKGLGSPRRSDSPTSPTLGGPSPSSPRMPQGRLVSARMTHGYPEQQAGQSSLGRILKVGSGGVGNPVGSGPREQQQPTSPTGGQLEGYPPGQHLPDLGGTAASSREQPVSPRSFQAPRAAAAFRKVTMGATREIPNLVTSGSAAIGGPAVPSAEGRPKGDP